VRYLRTLSTPRLVILVLAVLALSGGAAAIAVAASGGDGPKPPAQPLDQAIHDALTAPAPSGITARIKFTNSLFPSGALLGNVGSALMSGASGRMWLTDGHGRLELQSDAGDAQIVWNTTTVTVYDASSNTVYRADLPSDQSGANATGDSGGPPGLAEIDSFLEELGAHATISTAEPDNVAGQPAYSVTVSPAHDGGLLGSAELAWDAAQGVPLRIAIFAQGSSSPVLELEATDISYGPVADSDVEITPPADAKVVDLGSLAPNGSQGEKGNVVTGLAAVQAAADFPVTAPDTLVGLPRKDIRLLGSSDSKTAVAVYGQGLGAIVVVERKADAAGPGNGGLLSSLPSVSLDGVTAHELATQLGTALAWQKGGTAYTLGGSLPPAAAESAARELQ
jgi:outer membrane lipoprotein-sorting protein